MPLINQKKKIKKSKSPKKKMIDPTPLIDLILFFNKEMDKRLECTEQSRKKFEKEKEEYRERQQQWEEVHRQQEERLRQLRETSAFRLHPHGRV